MPSTSRRRLPIVTGYAGCEGGMVRRYARGYSEMTFSRIAVLTKAREAIIHKEFHLSSADPRLVGRDKARKIGRTNYDVADQLANLGMEAIHPRAGRGLRQTDIPLRVRNTFDREDEGTLISRRLCLRQPARRDRHRACAWFTPCSSSSRTWSGKRAMTPRSSTR